MSIRETTFIASSGQTTFAVDFEIFEARDVEVLVDGVVLAASDYFVNEATATVTLDTPLTAETVIVRSVIDGPRPYLLTDNQAFPAQKLNLEARRLSGAVEEMRRDLALLPRRDTPALRDGLLLGTADGSQFEAVNIGTSLERAGGVLGFDTGGRPVVRPPVLADDIGVAIGNVEARLDRTLADFGGVGDGQLDASGTLLPGFTDNTAALRAADAAGLAEIVVGPGIYVIAGDERPSTPLVFKQGRIVRADGGIFYARIQTRVRPTGSGRGATSPFAVERFYSKAEFDSQNGNPSSYFVGDGAFTMKTSTIYEGGREADGKFGPGTGTGAQTHYVNMIHLGQSDAYCTFWSGGVSTQGALAQLRAEGKLGPTETYDNWSEQPSLGMANGQTQAYTERVNLYGIGDMVLDDRGQNGVAVLGQVYFYELTGGDVAEYVVPRFGMLQSNKGTVKMDALYVGTGPARVGLDLTGVTNSDAALALSAGQKIAWAADDTRPPGKFSSQEVGAVKTYWTGTELVTSIEIGGVPSVVFGQSASGLRARFGTTIAAFSTDPTLGGGGASDQSVPTQAAVKGYVDGRQAAAIADLTAAPTASDFNALLAALRTAGLMAT